MNHWIEHTVKTLSSLLFLGLILQFLRITWAPYVYLVGATAFAYWTLRHRYTGKDITLQRLYVQQGLGAAILVLAGMMMIVFRHNEWILALAVGTLLIAYTSVRIPQATRKTKK